MKLLTTRMLFYTILSVATLSNIGCKKSFLDINTNPNNLTDQTITPELIFPAAITKTAARSVNNLEFLQHWMGFTSTTGGYAIDQQETTYSIDFLFGQTYWNNQYDVLYDLKQTETLALAKNDSVMAGAAIILSTKLWQDLVDLYGNIPYTEAFQPITKPQPKYDKDVDVYKSLQANLDRAINYMKGTQALTFAKIIGTANPLIKFGTSPTSGVNQSNWIKFANTLKLRLLIRTYADAPGGGITGITPSVEIAKIVSNGGLLGAGQSVLVNPGYVNDVNKQSPFFANYAVTPTGVDASPNERANAYTVTNMNINSDPRLQRLYSPAGSGGIIGSIYGAPLNTVLTGGFLSKLGPGVAGSAVQDQWILSSVETMFLIAEAVQRGWYSGIPSVAYQNAITESFSVLGVPSAGAAAFTYISSNPSANFTASITALGYQKYIAMNSINPLEAYSEFRRLNLSSVLPSGYISLNTASSTKIPNRLLYPQDEFTLNGTNANAQGDVSNRYKKIFWQQ